MSSERNFEIRERARALWRVVKATRKWRRLTNLSPTSSDRQAGLGQGILKGASRSRKTARKVYFPPEPEECEVIGEGGEDAGPPDDEDYDRPDDLDDDWGVSTQEDDPHEREEDKILQALTRSNTDFNSVASNLLENAPAPAPDPRKARAPLQLGKPLTDAEGKKQTLLVSVQPFGGKGDVTDKAPHVTKIQTGDIVAKSSPKTSSKQPKDNGGVVLKSIVVTNNELKTYVPSDPKPTPPQDGDASKSKEKNLFSKSPVVNGSSDSTLLKQKDAQAKANDSDKSPTPATPTVTTTTTTKKVDTTSQINSKHMFLKSIVDPGHDAVAKTPDSPGKTSPTTNGKESEIYLSSARAAARPEGKRTHITRGTPISKNNELLLKTKFIPLRMSAILSKNNERNSELNNETAAKKEQSHIVGFNGITMAPREVVLTVGRTDSSSEDDERTYSNIQVSSVDRSKDRSKERQRDRSKDKVKDRSKERPKERSKDHEEGAQTKRLSSLLAATLKSTDGEVVIVNRVGSRELAGEPDGRADPDSSSESGSEPPALPRSPPPAVDPRPSFLHGVHSLLAPSHSARTPDKPQVPFKSSNVVQAASSILSPAAVSARWSQLEAQMKAGSGGDPPQAPSSSPPSTPTQESPQSSPQGSPPDSCSRAQKRQAPKPPQVPASMDDAVAGLLCAERRGSLSPPPAPSPVKEEPLVLPSTASPIYARGLSTAKSQTPVCREKDKRLSHLQDRTERSERTERTSPPTRSESVPAALGQVALGQSVTLGTQSGQSVAHALAHHNFSSICAQPAGQPTPSPRRALSLSTDSLGPPGGKHGTAA